MKPGAMLSARGMHGTSLLLPTVVFAPALQKWQLGFFFFFVIMCFFVQNLPQLHTHTVIFSPL